MDEDTDHTDRILDNPAQHGSTGTEEDPGKEREAV
jgi:hypothetical protein